MLTTARKAAAIRGARTFIQAAAACIIERWMHADGFPTITSLIDTVGTWGDNAGGVGLLAALGAFGWNLKRPGPVTK